MIKEPLKIESGIPPPSKQAGRPAIYPFHKMKVGDSFFIPNVSKKFTIFSAVRYYNANNQEKISISQRREGNGVRIWRVA